MLEKYIQGTSKAVYNIYTGDESWIYAYEPETKQQSTVWVFQDEAKPTKVVRGRSTSKQMIACFFGINDHVATVALEQRRTVNSEWYTTICLPEVIGEIRKKQKNRRIILHHDNASSHTSTQTKAFLTERKIELMGHPPKGIYFVCGLLLVVSFCKGQVGPKTLLKIQKSPVLSPHSPNAKNCPSFNPKPMDCEEIRNNGFNTSGVYTIWPRSRILTKETARVYCDMTTNGGGWTVIQRRGDFGSPPDYFNKNWNYYKRGFGAPTKDFWLGNDLIYALTNQGSYSVRFEVQHANTSTAYALYEEFWIDNEDKYYELHISGYSGTAGDSMKKHDGQSFSTPEGKYTSDCAVTRGSGWWFHYCLTCNLNGMYRKGHYSASYNDGMDWETFGGYKNSMISSEIKIRPVNHFL
ncbi:techylectin-5A [Nephila pilipes]|uniref:Techylectin-5A n=1 Tax=Nephila pilipes TaxID=299642 RepID=A0A8X6QXR2_NEPPI|nr:techylectin-5A [Nephila pilipes]